MIRLPVILKYAAYFGLFVLVGEIISHFVFPWLVLPASIITAALIIRNK